MNNKHKMEKRFHQLLEYAEDCGFDSIHEDLELLPKGDLIAAIGFLSNQLNIPPLIAFDLESPLPIEEIA